ncbi:hypothetical protein Afil01_53650 [Actinorhabdospora filicis]|uniref:Uncharacterized protein n=1 Tax=Actinorhabdospora filicis TaxID=1785913 RepID=A0A9W6WBY9_9ACTN|nr:hypothetical protein [Actinorhabdospora filicis]GLZ80558.1 hypothetical protein Afil01_53650 [Actinorhabdospora filicis]
MDARQSRPRSLRHALVVAPFAWAAILAHAAGFAVAWFGFADPSRGAGLGFAAVLYVLVLVAALIVLPFELLRLHRGVAAGRVGATVAGLAAMPGFLCCSGFIGVAVLFRDGIERPEPLRDSMALLSGVAAGVAAATALLMVLYLWRSDVGRWLAPPLRAPRPAPHSSPAPPPPPKDVPHPPAPGEW